MVKSVKFILLGLAAVFLAIPAFHILAATSTATDPVGAGTIRGGVPAATSSEALPSSATPSTTGVSAGTPASNAGALPTPSQVPSPTPTFQESDSPTPQVESGQGSSDNDSDSNIPLILVAVAGAAALGFGLYKMMSGQANQNKTNKCNLIKATMDAKFKELTDLEGRIKGKIKGTIKGALEDALLTEGEKAILKKIEGAKGEYEKLKALYEECIVDVGTGKTKTLKFRAFKAEMILKGEKTSSLRVFDDKDLKAGDELELINWDTKKMFGKAKITEIIEKKLGEVGEKDLIGHEQMEGGPVEGLKKYYGEKVGPETPGKIVRFKLEK
ncbi:MAG: hypothetical protein Q7K44_02030 [Candidatus Liptonbacteria bacterium]|nr:hypothetical protein [Candidatus Liptonbacteria bacterium]